MTPCSTRTPFRCARPAPRRFAATAGLAAILGLAACGTAADPGTSSSDPAAGAVTPAAAPFAPSASDVAARSVTLESGWAKAGSGMTAVFGTVTNRTDQGITITGGTSPSAGEVQVHTMAKQADGSMKMMQKKGGLRVPAGGSVALEPGGDHLMLLELTEPLVNGDDVVLVMVTSSGDELAWTVPVRTFAGAEETYVPEDH